MYWWDSDILKKERETEGTPKWGRLMILHREGEAATFGRRPKEGRNM